MRGKTATKSKANNEKQGGSMVLEDVGGQKGLQQRIVAAISSGALVCRGKELYTALGIPEVEATLCAVLYGLTDKVLSEILNVHNNGKFESSKTNMKRSKLKPLIEKHQGNVKDLTNEVKAMYKRAEQNARAHLPQVDDVEDFERRVLSFLDSDGGDKFIEGIECLDGTPLSNDQRKVYVFIHVHIVKEIANLLCVKDIGLRRIIDNCDGRMYHVLTRKKFDTKAIIADIKDTKFDDKLMAILNDNEILVWRNENGTLKLARSIQHFNLASTLKQEKDMYHSHKTQTDKAKALKRIDRCRRGIKAIMSEESSREASSESPEGLLYLNSMIRKQSHKDEQKNLESLLLLYETLCCFQGGEKKERIELMTSESVKLCETKTMKRVRLRYEDTDASSSDIAQNISKAELKNYYVCLLTAINEYASRVLDETKSNAQIFIQHLKQELKIARESRQQLPSCYFFAPHNFKQEADEMQKKRKADRTCL
eukprot:scaffold195666_cov36-Cyclotella_meneghiniana.AAC.3